jgi:hypothetical protein
MPAWAWVVVGVVAFAAIAYALYRIVRTRGLERQFRGEYDRTVDELGSRRKAEADLRERARRRNELDVVPLSDASRQRYTDQWQIVQSRFVDAPADAVREADVLICAVMRERGYPVDDFEQRAADISVDHPDVVSHFRDAHGTKERGAAASTEQLRGAMVHYRALFESLVGGRVPSIPAPATRAAATQEEARPRRRRVS